MPANSRCHVVDEFNEGRYSYIIASDVSDVLAERDTQEGQWPQNDERAQLPSLQNGLLVGWILPYHVGDRSN
uniref:Transposase n=1 Tax=Ascaris lumbricoides TaxID=6252 RepID=A0A0M3HYN2_ASCLU